MKPSIVCLFVVGSTALALTPALIRGQATGALRPRNLNPAMIKPEPAFSKKAILGQAAKLNPNQLAKLNLFTHALLTPRTPATENAGLFMERPAQYDPLRDLAEFYSNQGNPAARFYPTFFDRPYLVDFTIQNRTSGQAEFDMDFGPAASANGVGEGFVSENGQVVKIGPGTQHATFVVFPKKTAWHWVAMKGKRIDGLWNVVSVEITYLK